MLRKEFAALQIVIICRRGWLTNWLVVGNLTQKQVESLWVEVLPVRIVRVHTVGVERDTFRLGLTGLCNLEGQLISYWGKPRSNFSDDMLVFWI
jgi:hypothetical protein